MSFKTAATAAVAALALSQLSAAVPVSRSTADPQCTSLGKGALGWNSSVIPIYSNNPPEYYITVATNDSDRLVVSTVPDYETQTMFEFFNCSYTPPASEDKGAIATYQGYIQAPNGECVTAQGLRRVRDYVKTEACRFSGDGALGNVDASQHFQFQLDTFYDYYSVDFLGATPGPVNATDFGAGGNYHFNVPQPLSMEGNNYLDLGHSKQAQTGNKSEMLIAQIGSQYKPTTRQLRACTLVKSGYVTLYNTATRDVKAVTTASSNVNVYAYAPQINNGGAGDQQYSFFACDSAYMGYTADACNWYGHFDAYATGQPSCFTRQTSGSLTDYVVTGPAGRNGASDDCTTADTEAQLQSFFHLHKTDDGVYEVSFVGATAAEADSTGMYGWVPTLAEGEAADGAQDLLVTQNASDWVLRFNN
ncbi:uncharacterized protein SRS1_15026 [Sporisorium reilianum f. sp. reilianum]|uniref:Uncharacterized protein n=1 Tax=Sporisorium reilianum f. sp. reilianum TaxID=72559 RepID=A0A2N8UHG3_9BASI|nr:uncharacterized protein SRS1_15026 [Sporisorium reilianum f. sp. reilianum]